MSSNGLVYLADRRLYLQMADEIFWCETCGRTHPLREHRECREPTKPERA